MVNSNDMYVHAATVTDRYSVSLKVSYSNPDQKNACLAYLSRTTSLSLAMLSVFSYNNIIMTVKLAFGWRKDADHIYYPHNNG